MGEDLLHSQGMSENDLFSFKQIFPQELQAQGLESKKEKKKHVLSYFRDPNKFTGLNKFTCWNKANCVNKFTGLNKFTGWKT